MTYTALFVGLSPVFVALIRKEAWAAERVAALAVGWCVIAYIGGRFLDGVSPSYAIDYLQGLAAAIVGQQTVYQLIKGTSFISWLEDVGGAKVASKEAT